MRGALASEAGSRSVSGTQPRGIAPLGRPLKIGVALAILALACLWLVGLHHAALLWPGQSDSAAAVLMGKDMLGGNWTLAGWLLPVDTYWLTEEPLYAAAVAIRGVGASLIHDVPLLIYLAVIASGVWLARRGSSGARAWMGAATSLTLLGLIGPAAAVTLLHGPAHISTALLCLLSFAALSRSRSLDLRDYALAFLLLSLALISDPIARVTGAAPIALVAAVSAVANRTWARSAAQLATVGGALVASQVVRIAAQVSGGYTVGGGTPGLVGPGGWLVKVPLFWSSLLKIFSADVASPDAAGVALSAAHFAVLLVLLGGGLFAIWRLWHAGADPEAWLDGTLVVAAAGVAAAFFLSGYAADETAIRYLSPAFIFGAVLAGRLVARVLPAVDRRAFAPAAVLLLLAYAGSFATTVSSAPPENQARPLAAWLLDRGLTDGFGAYWDANIVTVMSANQVRVRPVLAGAHGLEPSHWNSTLSWYRVPTQRRVTFLVFEPAAPWRGVDEASATATFGPPVSSHTVGPYRVLVWQRDLAPLLRPASN